MVEPYNKALAEVEQLRGQLAAMDKTKESLGLAKGRLAAAEKQVRGRRWELGSACGAHAHCRSKLACLSLRMLPLDMLPTCWLALPAFFPAAGQEPGVGAGGAAAALWRGAGGAGRAEAAAGGVGARGAAKDG